MKKKFILFTFTLLLFLFCMPNVLADNSAYGAVVSCGTLNDIPAALPDMTKFLVNLIKIIVPVALVVKGTIDIAKAITAQKDDQIQKAKASLLKRLVAAVAVFLVLAISQLAFDLVATEGEAGNVASCLNCFLNSKCGS